MLRPAIFQNRKPMFFDNEFDRFFDHAFSGFWGNDFQGLNGFRADVLDQGSQYLLQAELPGFRKEDISVDLSGDMLTITASHTEDTDKSDDKKNYIRKERKYQSYQRSFYVEGVTPSEIDAEYKNGILEITFPKKETLSNEENKRIEVK